jgi:hypothetical protein
MYSKKQKHTLRLPGPRFYPRSRAGGNSMRWSVCGCKSLAWFWLEGSFAIFKKSKAGSSRKMKSKAGVNNAK